MRLLTLSTVFALAGCLVAAPTSDDQIRFTIDEDWFNKNPVKYTADHEIVEIAVPLNRLNFDEDVYSPNLLIFFVEADQELYALKKGVATKLLDNARDVAAMRGNGYDVYFGAKDGIYTYNRTSNSAEKYGTLTDSIIAIEVAFGKDILYILTEDNVVYKVTESGTKKEKIDEIEGAKDIILDYSNNIYFYAEDKQPWVLADGEDVKKIEGLPEITAADDEITLVRPPFVLQNGVGVLLNNQVYIVRSDGKSEFNPVEFAPEVVPSALAPEATLAQFYALDKKIYEYDVLSLFAESALDELDDYLNKKTKEIPAISSKRGTLKSKISKIA